MTALKDVRLRAEPIQATDPGVRRRGFDWFVFVMLLGISGYLFLNLFLLANVPILLSGDQVFFWMNGQRMLKGERPYLDFFQFTPPGADLFYFGLFKLFGTRIWPLNFAVLVLGVALCWVCFVISSKIMERQSALLSTLLFLTLVYTRLLNATHHCFSILAIMGATAVLMRESSTRRLAAAGALLGLASFFTQTHGVAALVGVTLLLGWERCCADRSWLGFWGKERVLLSGFAFALIILNAPFIVSVGPKLLWYFQVTYVSRVMVHAPETHLLGMPQYPDWRALPLSFLLSEYSRHVFVYSMLPTVYLLALLRCRKEVSLSRLRGVALLGLVGSLLLGELIFSLNWLRLYAVSMPGLILFVWVTSNTEKLRRYGTPIAWVVVVLLGLSQTWSRQHDKYIQIDLPAGRSAVDPKEFEKLSWGMDHVKPGDFLFQANWPGIYIPLGVRNPVFLDTAATMLNPRWAERVVQQLEAKQVRFVVWAPRFEYPVDPRRPTTAHIVPLRTYLHMRYRLAKVFVDGEQVWERR
jgi:hypothetical protein